VNLSRKTTYFRKYHTLAKSWIGACWLKSAMPLVVDTSVRTSESEPGSSSVGISALANIAPPHDAGQLTISRLNSLTEEF
jgi:hypothetical protein